MEARRDAPRMAKITPLRSDQDEREIVERVKTEPEAFGELYRRHAATERLAPLLPLLE